jgi:bifunctional DNA-binding transcriptional regulator/antitoxin component of YhaV-PrlF toxin-antitoxin module
MTTVVKVTSKGQLTLPIKLRKDLGITKESYLLVDEIGEFLVLKKIQKLDEITKIFSALAKKKGITKKEIFDSLEKLQEEKWNA